jgi:hypothetical protein
MNVSEQEEGDDISLCFSGSSTPTSHPTTAAATQGIVAFLTPFLIVVVALVRGGGGGVLQACCEESSCVIELSKFYQKLRQVVPSEKE